MKYRSKIAYDIDNQGFYDVFFGEEQKYVKLNPEVLSVLGITETPNSYSNSISFLNISVNDFIKDNNILSVVKKNCINNFVIKRDTISIFSFYCKDLRVFLNDFNYGFIKDQRRVPEFLFQNDSIFQALCFLKGFIAGSFYKKLNNGKIVIKLDYEKIRDSVLNLFHFCGLEAEIKEGKEEFLYITWNKVEYNKTTKSYDISGIVSDSLKNWFCDWKNFNDFSQELEKQPQAYLEEKAQINYRNYNIIPYDEYVQKLIKGFNQVGEVFIFDGIPKYVRLKVTQYNGFSYRVGTPFFENQQPVLFLDYNYGDIPIISEVYPNHIFYFTNANDRKFSKQQNFRIIRENDVLFIIPETHWYINSGKYMQKWRVEKYDNTTGEIISRANFSGYVNILPSDGISEEDKASVYAEDFNHIEDNTLFYGIDNEYKSSSGFYLSSIQPEDNIRFFKDFPECKSVLLNCLCNSSVNTVTYSDKGGGCTEGQYSSIIENVTVINTNTTLFKELFNDLGKDTIINEDITKSYNINYIDGIINILPKQYIPSTDYSYVNKKEEQETILIPLNKTTKKTQQIFYPGEIGSTGNINGIGIYISNDFNNNFESNFDIYLEETEDNYIEDFIQPEENNKYFSDTILLSKGINWISFNNTFNYTGKNIKITIINNNTEETNIPYYCTEQENCTIYIDSNNNSNIINLKNNILFSFINETNKNEELFIGCQYPFIEENDSFNYNTYFPLNVNSNSTFSQFIYRSNEIVFDGDLKSLEFYFTGKEDYTFLKNLLIFINVVKDSDFNSYKTASSIYNINLDDYVFKSESYVIKNGWNTINFNKSIKYNKVNEDNTKNNLIITFFSNSYILTEDNVTDYNINLNDKINEFLCFNTTTNDSFSQYKKGSLLTFSSVSSNDFFNYKQKPVLKIKISK